MDKLETKRFRLIHEAIHNKDATHVIIDNKYIEIKSGKKARRYLTWQKNTFIQEDPDHQNWTGRIAASGNKVTWVIRHNRLRWGLIIGNEIVRE